MRSLTLPSFVLALVLFAPGVARAADAPGVIEDLRAEIDLRRAALGEPGDRQTRQLAKALDKALRALGADRAAESRRHELSAARRAAKQIERRARDEAELVSELDAALHTYDRLLRADVERLQAVFAEAFDAGDVPRGLRKRTRRATRGLDKSARQVGAAKRLRLLIRVDKALSILPDAGDDPADPVDPGGGGGDGGDPGGGDDGGPDPGRTITWVIDSLAIAATGTGFDLDGDGTIDNALAGMQAQVGPLNGGAPIDGYIAQNITQGARITVLQMWAVHDLSSDSDVSLGMLEPADIDGDATDNLNGQEEFAVAPGSVDADGHAVTNATTALTNGAYTTSLPQSLTNPVINTGLGLGTSVSIRGVVSESRNDGTIGVVFSGTDTALLVNAMLPPFNAHLAAGIVASLLDIDTTGNGIPDSMSAAFDFTSVRCTLR
jgi:hypothetical protein